MFVILRRKTADSKPEFYAGGGFWSPRETLARTYNAPQASVMCENFTTKLGAQYAEIVFREKKGE